MSSREPCKAMTISGSPCKNPATPGSVYCHVHRHLGNGTERNSEANPLERLQAWWQGWLRRYWPVAVLLAVLAAVASAIQLYTAITGQSMVEIINPTSPQMSGDFRIAVAGFAEQGQPGDSEIGLDLGRVVFAQLTDTLAALDEEEDLDFIVEVWGPEQVGTVLGSDAGGRADAAVDLAATVGADLVVYGWLDTSEAMWQVTPEFFVSLESFYQAEEIAGQHDLGAPFYLVGQDRLPARMQMREQFTSRAQALAQLTSGLAYLAYRNFGRAFTVLRAADEIDNWEDEEGKEVLYLLLGYAAIKLDDIDGAHTYYERSQEIDPDYARAYIGLGSVHYMRGLQPFERSQEPADIDTGLMDQAIATYLDGLAAPNQPLRSDVETKVRFALGQCHLAKVYAGRAGSLDHAVAEFQAVVDEYGGGDNPRMRVLAAEAHGRLGLAYELGGEMDLAIEHYGAASSLLGDDPQRQRFFQDEAADLADGSSQLEE